MFTCETVHDFGIDRRTQEDLRFPQSWWEENAAASRAHKAKGNAGNMMPVKPVLSKHAEAMNSALRDFMKKEEENFLRKKTDEQTVSPDGGMGDDHGASPHVSNAVVSGDDRFRYTQSSSSSSSSGGSTLLNASSSRSGAVLVPGGTDAGGGTVTGGGATFMRDGVKAPDVTPDSKQDRSDFAGQPLKADGLQQRIDGHGKSTSSVAHHEPIDLYTVNWARW